MSENLSSAQEFEKSIVTERNLSQYCEKLDFNPKDLKRWHTIVDLGSGTSQNFAREVHSIDDSVNIISIDPRLSLDENRDLIAFFDEEKDERIHGRKASDPMTLSAIAQNLPLQNNSVGAVLALHSVPQYTKSQNDIELSISEIIRVLRAGGEARIYPISKNDNYEAVARSVGQHKNIEFEFNEDSNNKNHMLLKLIKKND